MILSDTSPFAEACGIKSPIDLRILRDDGTVLAEGELELPCALVGRDNVCEVTLLEADVSLRHACIQAVGGRVMLADIGSRLGVSYGQERQPFVWLTPTTPVFLGSFRISLRRPLFVRPTIPELSPFLPHPPTTDLLPRVGVRFLNGKSFKSEWVVNRVVTFVGRAHDCKISLGADDVAPYHCYLVLTPQGLWVVDLLTDAGIRVNGELVRYARLNQGDELQVGRFRLGFQYIDEAPLSVVLTSIPSREPATTPPPLITSPKPRTNVLLPQVPDFTAAIAPLLNSPVIASNPAIAPLIEQFAIAQAQMMEQFQQSMVMVMNMFGQMHREQMDTMQAELNRMSELNTEMQKLQSQMMEQRMPLLAVSPELHRARERNAMPPDITDTEYNSVYERISALQNERQNIWRRLFGMMNPKVNSN